MLSTKSHPAYQIPIDNDIDGITVKPNELLRDLLQTDSSLIEVAAAHKLSLQQLLVWCDQPAIRTLFEAMDELALRRATHKSAQARHLAVQLLSEHCLSLCETARDRDQAGRAARALLRLPATPTDEAPPPRKRTKQSRVQELLEHIDSLPRTPDSAPPNSLSRFPIPASPLPTSPLPAPSTLRFPVYRFALRQPESPHRNGHAKHNGAPP